MKKVLLFESFIAENEKETAKEIFDELMDVNGEEIADMDSQEAMTMLSRRGIRGGKANKIAKELLKLTSAIGESVVNESEAENILQDLLDERGGDIGELHGMGMEDALDTVEAYGHKGSKAKKIAQELVSICNESVVTEAKKLTIKDVEKAWDSMYGEDFKDEYSGVHGEIMRKYKGKITKTELHVLWYNYYGEDLKDDHGGFFDSLDENLKESVVNEAKAMPTAKAAKKFEKDISEPRDAANLASWVYDNYDAVTGLDLDARDEEMDFPGEVEDLIDFLGFDYNEFEEAYGEY